jgi:phage tail sheath protein FI
MPFYHGIKVAEGVTTVPTPLVALSGIPFVVGTAPVQSVGGGANVPVLAETYAQAVAALGYSDDWKTYTLCEFMDAHFKLYGCQPVIFLNVLDPTNADMKEAVAAADMAVTNKQIKLSIDAIDSTVVVKAAGGAGDPYDLDTDYSLLYDGEYLIIEVLSGGAIYSAASLSVAYSKIKISGVTATEIVGGYDTETKLTTGLECVNQVMALHGLVPDLICAPGWSHNSTVAAAMAAKAAGINGLFTAKALIDALTTSAGVDHYSEVAAWKATNGIIDKTQLLCWPMVRNGGKVYHMSTHVAGLMASVDAGNDGCPYESPSNKALQIDSIVTDDGDGTYSEVILTLTDANTLNAAGVVTAINFMGSFKLWGNNTAAYGVSAEVKDYFIPVSRMFGWVGSTLIQTFWSKLDRPMSKLLIGSIVDNANIWLNGLVSEGKLYGARVEYIESENTAENLAAGIIKLHVYMTPPSPAQEIDFTLEYSAAYVAQALAV